MNRPALSLSDTLANTLAACRRGAIRIVDPRVLPIVVTVVLFAVMMLQSGEFRATVVQVIRRPAPPPPGPRHDSEARR